MAGEGEGGKEPMPQSSREGREGGHSSNPERNRKTKQVKNRDETAKTISALKRTDFWVATFTVVSGLAAALSALAAVYTARQIRGSSEQMDNAIGTIARLAAQTKRQADKSADQVAILREELEESTAQTAALNKAASAAASGVNLQAKDFALDQRPVIGADSDPRGYSTVPAYDAAMKIYYWNYGIHNFGKSTAFRVREREDLSVFGLPFAREYRFGDGELVPTESNWSTGWYKWPLPSTIKVPESGQFVPYVLRVVITYSDAGHRWYSKEICMKNAQNGTVHICNDKEVDKLGIDPRSERKPKGW